MSIKATLKSVSFLSELTDVQLEQLAGRGRVISVGTGEVIFHAGDEANCMYIILSGQVKIYLYDDYDHEIALATLEAGDFFGEMALLDDGTRSASVASLSPCEFFLLERSAFFDLLAISPQFLSQQFRDLSRRLRESDQRFLHEQIAQQVLRAEMEAERRRALVQLVAGVAHEVNTPLGIINTAASVIKRGLTAETITALATDLKTQGLLEEVLEATDLIQKHITRAHALVQSFKNVAVDQIIDIKEAINLSEAVVEILDLFKLNARQARLEVNLTDTLTDQTRTWMGYRGHLSRILFNLLSNVERYAYPEGNGGTVELSVTAEHEGQVPCFCITVRDFGKGIVAEDLPRVFDPFFTTGRGKGGTGLGLTMVYNLVTEVLKGNIAIMSEPNQGTTVCVTFPQTVID